jgi:hypothetical protein
VPVPASLPAVRGAPLLAALEPTTVSDAVRTWLPNARFHRHDSVRRVAPDSAAPGTGAACPEQAASVVLRTVRVFCAANPGAHPVYAERAAAMGRWLA